MNIKKHITKKNIVKYNKKTKKIYGGSNELYEEIKNKYSKLEGNNYSYDILKLCSNLRFFKNPVIKNNTPNQMGDKLKSLRENVNSEFAEHRELIRNVLNHFMSKLLINDKYLHYVDLYTAMPIHIFLSFYINYRLEEKNSCILRGKKFETEFDTIDKLIEDSYKRPDKFDKNYKYRKVLTSTNLSILGNSYHGTSGESTIKYFLTASSQLGISIRLVIKQFLFSNYPKLEYKYVDTIENMINHLTSKDMRSVMIQYLINKKVASQIAYLSYAYGYSVFNTKELNNTYWNSITSEKSKMIDELIDNKMRNEYDNVDKLYKMTNISNTTFSKFKGENLSCIKFVNLQSRIVYTKESALKMNKETNGLKNLDFNFYPNILSEIPDINSIIHQMKTDNDKSIDELYKNEIDLINNNVTKLDTILYNIGH